MCLYITKSIAYFLFNSCEWTAPRMRDISLSYSLSTAKWTSTTDWLLLMATKPVLQVSY